MYISQNYYSLFPQLQKIVRLYQEVEEITSNVKNLFSAKCPEGCGQCCNTACNNIEASIVEMLPLCIHLYEQNTYLMWLDKTNQNLCPFYETERTNHRIGCCAVYEYRPLVCRLFGFTFMTHKFGAIVPVACTTLQKQYSAKKEIIAMYSSNLPHISSISMQSMMIDSVRGNRYPINEAFQKAIEYVVLKMRFSNYDEDLNNIA